MIDIQLSPHEALEETRSQSHLFLLGSDFARSPDFVLAQVISREPRLSLVLKQNAFTGKEGDEFILSVMNQGEVSHLIFVGIGLLPRDENEWLEMIRRGIGRSVKVLKKLKLEHCYLNISSLLKNRRDPQELVKAIVIAAHMSCYEFTRFKTEESEPQYRGILTLVAPREELTRQVHDACVSAAIIAQAVNFARNLGDLPANVLTPRAFAQEAQNVAAQYDLQCTIFNRAEALEKGLVGFCFVDAASDQDGQFIILQYDSKIENAPTIALVGKGIIFDTGGISLKPRVYMSGMKFDMSGAAATLATIKALAQLKVGVNVVGIMPVVENMIGGKAGRPDDIITYLNGVNVEVQDTDCEGRLVLADGLCYAEKFYKPHCIIDIATLTGACSAALGPFYSGLMTRNEKMAQRLAVCGDRTGDKIWRLPLHDDYKAAIESSVADIGNYTRSGYGAGTITAAHFLENFVSKTPWAHLDIAGTAHEVPAHAYVDEGATGAGVRLLIDFIMSCTS